MKFNEMGLHEQITRAISEMGFETPTLIQEKAIPLLLTEERDMVGLAQTGTGKTASFGLPILHHLGKHHKTTGALILAPTRELANQITDDINKYNKYLKEPRILAVYGGASYEPQIKALRAGVDILVATPGRLVDLIKKKHAKLDSLRYLVLDEADLMLHMGFKDELDAILEASNPDRQTILLSATMPAGVARIARQYMKNPVEITAGEKNSGADTLEHKYCMVHARDKYKALKRLVDFNPGIYGIVFCRTRRDCQVISEKLIKDGYNADALHGDLSQSQREYTMGKFRDQAIQILVATDIAARGLDVKNLSHVIHYDLPDEVEAYNHRSGRTGRAGNKGISLAIINMREKYKIRQIEKIIKSKLSEFHLPTGKEICESQMLNLIDRVRSAEVDWKQIAPFMDAVEEKLDGMSREELIHHFISLEFNRFLDYYKKEPDIQPITGNRGREQVRGGKKRKGNDETSAVTYQWLSINLGKRDNIQPQQIIGLINQMTKGTYINLGKIEIKTASTLFQVEVSQVKTLIDSLKRKESNGKRLRVDKTDAPKGGGSRSGGRSGGYKGSRGGAKRRGSSTRSGQRGRR